MKFTFSMLFNVWCGITKDDKGKSNVKGMLKKAKGTKHPITFNESV